MTSETEPSPIPRRVVFRALADCLGGQARHLESLSPGRSGGKRGEGAAGGTAAKAEGRARRAADLKAQAARLSARVADPACYRGPGLDAAVVGYLVALAYDYQDAWPELLAEAEGAGLPPPPPGLAREDLFGVLDWLCGT